MKANVRLRETGHFVAVNITDGTKPEIKEQIISKWQKIIDVVAKILSVPSALIMKITEENMEVFLRSTNKENPYHPEGKDKLGHGLYCETVLGTNSELLVENALELEAWKDNPDVALNMISYYGLPLTWKDGEFFGTICVLDNHTRKFKDKYRELLNEMKTAIESDLELLEMQEHLEKMSIHDFLTGAYNRRYSMQLIEELIDSYKKDREITSVIMFDIDRFKKTNDNYGHLVGDKILVQLVENIMNILDLGDKIARYGGDEFLVFLRNTDKVAGEDFIKRMNLAIKEDDYLKKYQISVSSGLEQIDDFHNTFDSIVKSADFKMLAEKKKKHKESKKIS